MGEGKMMEYALIRSNRNTMSFRVRKGILEVHAPKAMSVNEINKLLTDKLPWIQERMEIQRRELEIYGVFNLTYGKSINLLDEKCTIMAKDGKSFGFENKCFFMPPGLNSDQIQKFCAQIYRLLAEDYIPKRTWEFANTIAVKPSAVKISNAKTKWGSCSAKKSLNFSWTLMMCESALVDYVIIHELAHLIELSHSARFWSIVNTLMPDYEIHKAKLWDTGKRINAEYWFD